MKKYLPFIVLVLSIIFFVIYSRKNVSHETIEKTIDNIDTLSFVSGNIVLEKDKEIATDSFDWLGDQCACQTNGGNAMVIQSIRPIPYVYERIEFAAPVLELPDYIKGSFDITRDKFRQSMTVFTPPEYTFTWGWDGLRRVIRTSNGYVLDTGLGNKLWTRADGGSIIAPITAIQYNGIIFKLER